jgi:putative flippase GtrA
MRDLSSKFLNDRRFRYLAVGGLNTLVGFACANALYYTLSPGLHIVVIGVLGNIICITFSFLTYKTIVFRTKGGWPREYLRCYMVYGLAAALGVMGLWVLVDCLGFAFWLAQALVIAVTVFFSYMGHSRFSFSRGAS